LRNSSTCLPLSTSLLRRSPTPCHPMWTARHLKCLAGCKRSVSAQTSHVLLYFVSAHKFKIPLKTINVDRYINGPPVA
jgi:hypothetical protein